MNNALEDGMQLFEWQGRLHEKRHYNTYHTQTSNSDLLGELLSSKWMNVFVKTDSKTML